MYVKPISNLITYTMKRLFLFVALTITVTVVYGQKSIDALFERYAGRDGFVTITINGNMLKLATRLRVTLSRARRFIRDEYNKYQYERRGIKQVARKVL